LQSENQRRKVRFVGPLVCTKRQLFKFLGMKTVHICKCSRICIGDFRRHDRSNYRYFDCVGFLVPTPFDTATGKFQFRRAAQNVRAGRSPHVVFLQKDGSLRLLNLLTRIFHGPTVPLSHC
jgi:hypothetical protein